MPDSTTAPAQAQAAAPLTAPQRPYYVAHAVFTLPNGDRFARGDVLRGPDALAFEVACAAGETNLNFATPHDIDPEA